MKRILTIDGGGLKGMVPAAMLAELETTINLPIAQYFDLIVGTSTGGLIAAGLALGWNAADIVKLYHESGPRIFPTLSWLDRARLWCIGTTRTKYPTKRLRAELEGHFGNTTLGAAQTRLVLPSWDRNKQSVSLWKTRHCGRFRIDHLKPIVEALVSTASAPAYFSSARKDGGSGLVDGGVWANNPMLVAAVEAVGILKWRPESVCMLSLGCVHEAFIPPASGGLFRWAMPAPLLFLQAQSSGATGSTYLLLRDRPLSPERVFRIEADAPPGHFTLDGAHKLRELEDLGRSMARDHLHRLAPLFFSNPAVPFVPLPKDAGDDELS